MTDVEQRPRFYEGQYLEAADLMAAVDYGRSQLARTVLGGHRWGIALGLDLTEVLGPNGTVDVFAQPGYAWDGFGRPILVAEPTKIPTSLLAPFDADFVPGNPPPPPRVVEVWIRFQETMTGGPRPGFESCGAQSAFARVLESFQLEVGPRNVVAQQRDPIEIAGRLIDAAQALVAFDAGAPVLVDATVPHQTFPAEGDTARWLVPLGVVSWQPGDPGHFAARGAAELTRHQRSRQYAGVVASSIETSNGHVRVHDRGQPYSSFSTDELLWVEGDLRADGHVRLYGRRVEFVESHTEDPIQPFQVLRSDDVGGGRAKLQLVIGDGTTGANRLAVGPESGADTYLEHMVVTDEGHVGIGTSEPKALLHLTEDGLQIGTSAVPEDNFYLQSNTDGPRALRLYNKDVGAGAHLASFTATGRVGLGVTEPSNVLHVAGSLGIRQNALYVSGDPAWSSLTYNAHHNEANNAWVFPDPTKPAVTIEMDSAGGTPRFEVYSTLAGANQSWVSRFRVAGHSGDIAMGHNGGNVGIGTVVPTSRLDVQGDLRVSGEIRFGPSSLKPVGASTGVRVVWGNVGGTGTKVSGDGYTVARLGTGRYRVTFDLPFLSRPTVVVTKVFQTIEFDASTSVEPRENAIVDQIDPAWVIVATADTDGALADSNFCLLAIGPR